jgi:hypothetical protein
MHVNGGREVLGGMHDYQSPSARSAEMKAQMVTLHMQCSGMQRRL